MSEDKRLEVSHFYATQVYGPKFVSLKFLHKMEWHMDCLKWQHWMNIFKIQFYCPAFDQMKKVLFLDKNIAISIPK